MNPIKILLVDDSKSARYALRLQLQRHRAVVETADSAEAALERIKEVPPDAVFMDHTMPGMNGFEALEILKSNPETSHIPVVMCTSNEDPEFIAQARRKGAMDILSKATASDKLAELIDRLDRAITATERTVGAPPPTPDTTGEVNRLLGEQMEERLRALVEPIFEALADRLSTRLEAKTEEMLLIRSEEHAQRLQQHFTQIQSEQAQLTTNRLVNELIPKVIEQHLARVNERLVQTVKQQIAEERHQIAKMVHELVDSSVDQIVEQPAFLRRVLDATEAFAATTAEQVVNRQAREVARAVATQRAEEVAHGLIASAGSSLRAMYLLAGAAAAVGVASAIIVYFGVS